MANGFVLEETELRLGLGLLGGGEGEGAKKGGFEETIDLKLWLQMPSDMGESEVALESYDNMVKKTPNLINIASWGSGGGSGIHPKKPFAPKAQAMGWPLVRSFRKNILSVHSEKHVGDSKEDSGNSTAAFLKVSMDGAPYLRKVDLKMYRSYQELSVALQKMFSSFTTNTGMSGRDYTNESKVMDLLNGSEYVPTYEDKDGDWMLAGDVPWEMFVDTCKRLCIIKGSEAIGIASRTMEKFKNRS